MTGKAVTSMIGALFLSLILGIAARTCQQDVNCFLPNCSCPSTSHPIPPANRPQIVYFGFDDAVTVTVSKEYRILFDSGRRNPNGCPITMTLYAQHDYTDYSLVREFYLAGHEMGVHSVTHKDIATADDLRTEAYQQRQNIATYAGVPLEEIQGWRSPNLKTAGDDQPPVLASLNYTYDVSLTYDRRKIGDPKPWPYTLDYGYPYSCSIPPCPSNTTSHPGFWEVPINAYIDYKLEYPCSYVDGCYNRPSTPAEAFLYLRQNFDDYYYGGRAPFGLHMHAAWLLTTETQQGMEQFLDYALSFDDVYVVTTRQMLDWVQNPKTLANLGQLESWSCSTKNYPPETGHTEITKRAVNSPTIPRLSTPKITSPRMTSLKPTTQKPATFKSTTPRPATPAPTTAKVPSVSAEECQQGVNCQLPDCYCSSMTHSLEASQRPQIVYFGFDDAVTVTVASHYRKLFPATRKNPSGCPISMALYAQHDYTDYSLVREFYQGGHEIGVHSVTHSDINTGPKLRNEANQQRLNLATQAGVPINSIQGWRSPNLLPAGDAQPEVLSSLNYTYDITLTYTRRKLGEAKPWPFTLDYGYPYECMVPPCPGRTTSHPGFWVVPVNSVMDIKNEYPCVYIDGCYNRPANQSEAFTFLWQNFMDYYNDGRAPFGLHMHAAWFMTPDFLLAMEQFIEECLKLPDVYIVTPRQMLDWVQNPKTLPNLLDLESWNCYRT